MHSPTKILPEQAPASLQHRVWHCRKIAFERYARIGTVMVVWFSMGVFVPAGLGIGRHDGVDDLLYRQHGLNFSSMVWLSGINDDGDVWKGSSVVIDPHWALTAAHTLFDEDNQFEHIGARIGTGTHVWDDPGQTFVADQWFSHPDWDYTVTGVDLALLYFDDPIVGVEPATRFRGTDQIGNLIDMAGFGVDATPSGGVGDDPGRLRACQNLLTEFGFPPFGAAEHFAVMRFVPPGHPAYQPLGGIGIPGDSGGGWYIDVEGEMQLMGISSFQSGAPNYFGSTAGMRLSLFNDWIDDTIASIPEPGTFVLLGACWFVLIRRR